MDVSEFDLSVAVLRPHEREAIARAEQLWDLTCQRLLGRMAGREYRRATAALLDGQGEAEEGAREAVRCD